jgi:hypothetical protein
MLVYANEGFDFNPWQNNLGNHGALRHEIAHNSLFMSGCSAPAVWEQPVLGEQIGATIKKAFGDDSLADESLDSAFDQACKEAVARSISDQKQKNIRDQAIGVSNPPDPKLPSAAGAH